MTEDHIEREFEALRSSRVPRRLDCAALAAAGERQLRRRRTAGASAFTAVGLTAAGVAVSADWPDGPGDPARSTMTATPQESKRSWPSFELAVEDYASDELIATYAAAGSDPKTSVDFLPLVDGQAAGYVGMMTSLRSQDVARAGDDLCDIEWHPMDGVGRSCEVRSDDEGRYAVLTYSDSGQGRTVLVRVASEGAVVTLAESLGWPHYPAAEDTDPTLLPWDLRDAVEPESGEPGENPERAQLDELPLTAAELAEIARAYASDPPASGEPGEGPQQPR